MRKLFSVFVVGCLLLTSCGGGKTNKGNNKALLNDLQKEHMQGSVTSVRQRVYWAVEKFGRTDKGKLQNMPAQDYLKVYDRQGYLVEETHYDATDKVVSSRKIEYGKGHRIDVEEVYKESALSERIVYTYGDNNKLEKKEKFDGDGNIKEWYKYAYNDDGELQDEDCYKADGTLQYKYVYHYDGALVAKQKYWGGGSLAQSENYMYDVDGNLVEVTSEKYKNKEASFDYRYTYEEYNSFGDYGIKTQYNPNGNEVLSTVYSYDDYGNLLQYLNLVKEEVAQPMATPIAIEGSEEETVEAVAVEYETMVVQQAGYSYSYTFDDRNNWTQKITYKITDENSERQFYYDRVVTYR